MLFCLLLEKNYNSYLAQPVGACINNFLLFFLFVVCQDIFFVSNHPRPSFVCICQKKPLLISIP